MSRPQKFPSIDLEVPALGSSEEPIPMGLLDAIQDWRISRPWLGTVPLFVLVNELISNGLYDLNLSDWDNVRQWIDRVRDERLI